MKPLAKSVHSALVFSLLLALAGSLPAEARPGGYSGTSAFRGGFSSQRMAPAKSLAANRTLPQKSAPGSFGGAAGASAAAAAPARSGSASARDMEQSAAQANALKTLDARRAAAMPPPVPPAVDPVARPGQPMPGAYPMPQQTIIVQPQQHSGFMYGLMGFMLGRSMSAPQPVYYPASNGNGNNGNNNANNNGSGDNGGGNGGNSGPDSAGWNDANRIGMTGGYDNTSAAQVAPQPQPSFGASVLRVLAWLLLPVVLAVLVHAIGKRLRRNRAAANYSFERK